MLLWKMICILNKKLISCLNLPITSISLYHRLQILLYLRNLKPNPCLNVLPPPLDNVEWVKFAKLLGIYFCDILNFDKHIEFILTQCSQRVYLMKLLQDQGLSDKNLDVVFKSVIILRLFDALSAWEWF